jgi:hypothetical protein
MKGIMPGHHLIPEDEAHEAIHHYKTLHGLHNHHHHPQHLPHMHPHHIMEEGLRGGFLPAALLPLLAGAAVPLIGEAVKGLIGGFANQGGSHLANKLAGNGLRMGVPMIVHHGGRRHFHLHGDGFMDLIRSAMRHVKNIFTSQPARKLGHHAVGALKEAFMHALTQKVDSLHNKILPEAPPEPNAADLKFKKYMSGAKEKMMGEEPPAYEESERFTPAELDHEDLTGTGLRRRKRRAPPKRKAPTKRHRPMMHAQLPLY